MGHRRVVIWSLHTTPSLSEILDLTVLVPNTNGVTAIDYRYVERTVVLAFDNNCCSVL